MSAKLISTMLAAMVLLSFVAVAEQPADLKPSILASAESVNSYKVAVSNVVKDTFTNSTGSYLVTVTTTTNSAYDRNAGASGATTTNTVDFNGNRLGSGVTQAYLMGGMIYNNINNNWTKYSVSNPAAVLDQLDDYKGNAQFIYNTTVDVLGTDQIDGKNYYKLQVTPAMGFLDFVALDQLVSALYRSPIMLPAMLSPSDIVNATSNGNALLKNSNITWTVWVSQDSYQIRRILNSAKVSVSPDMLNLPPNKKPAFSLDIESSVTFDYSDINMPVNLALPSAAQNAITVNPSAQAGAPTGAPTGAPA